MFDQTIIKKIAQQGARIEKLGTLPEDLLKIVFEHKLFKLFVPLELGGKMLELPQAVRVFQESSSIDGNFGWLVTIGSGGNMFVPNFEEKQCEKLFSPANAVIAGSGHPTGTAVKTADGYIVTGEWKYCSGASYASMFTTNSFIENSDEIISCIFLPEQVKVVEDWDAFGLKGTGSHTIQVKEAFIPLDRTFNLMTHQNDYKDLVHRFPFVQFSQSSFAAVCLGIGQSFFEEARKLVDRNKGRWTDDETDKYELISNLIEKEFTRLSDIEQSFYTTLDSLWQTHKQGLILEAHDLQDFSRICQEVAAITIDSANVLVRHFGMEAVKESSTLNRIWRNLHTAGQHTFLTPPLKG